eukprot:4670166-Amphidinium_carterae.1
MGQTISENVPSKHGTENVKQACEAFSFVGFLLEYMGDSFGLSAILEFVRSITQAIWTSRSGVLC